MSIFYDLLTKEPWLLALGLILHDPDLVGKSFVEPCGSETMLAPPFLLPRPSQSLLLDFF
jgi:hypothetical protein